MTSLSLPASIAPCRKRDIASGAVRALIAGTAACFMTACIAGWAPILRVLGTHRMEGSGRQASRLHIQHMLPQEAENRNWATHTVKWNAWDGVEKLRTEGGFWDFAKLRQ